MILSCTGGPPYVVHGPPGTGKTVTLIEAILQLYKTQSNSVILVCAASNSAADHVFARLVTFKVRKGDILRLGSTFNHKQLKRCRIIVFTYASADLLYPLHGRMGRFTHMFLDDAAQVSEPETMIPISLVYRRNMVVVLSGDPLFFSKDSGLGKSFMERLCELNCYKDGNKNYVTKLVRNYRSHKHILSQVLYKGDLVSCKEEDTLYLEAWKDFIPNPDFPVLFIGVQGVDESEGNSLTSWFNRIEANEVVVVILYLICKGIKKGDIGVITPYRQQVLKLRKALEMFDGLGSESGIKVGTVESFEGP
ncbi:putative DNA helicase [Helianthus annuus]|uniref:DNA helicase n=1 Tax=Helianthus annuus TaxID=4232 RepID=A0A251UVD4_HELAN|nr:putative DNA helicase [Helianthus annuus]KAJ0595213.1 putative DNA helicase [Helianthus annuus]KAJ0924766.1 putative DNA helicase [Helianthus annuus]KAJ0929358.1 putative DNA helicase [Helianthus annuus]